MTLDGSHAELTWTARNQRPVVAIYVGVVFLAMVAVAYFVFHSKEAVKALVTGGLGTVVAVIPAILARHEYRLTETGVSKRPLSSKKPREFKELFRWDELSHLSQTSSGFKYFKKLDEPDSLTRFFKLHFSGKYSGEIHVEQKDRQRLRMMILGKGIRI